MVCPKCGAAVQPYDRFCINCGHDMRGDGPTRQDEPAATVAPVTGQLPYATPEAEASYGQQNSPYTQQGSPYAQQPSPYAQQPSPYAQQGSPPPYATETQSRRNNANRWASGSSVPQANPYTSVPNTVSSGTWVNGRQVGSGRNNAVKGIGGAIIAFFIILGKAGAGLLAALGHFGGVIAGLGFFKFLIYWWAFRFLFGIHLGWFVLAILLVIVIGAIWRSQTA